MKKIQLYIFVSIISASLFSCKKEQVAKVNNGSVENSPTTQIPEVKLDGHIYTSEEIAELSRQGQVKKDSEQREEFSDYIEKLSWDPTQVFDLRKSNEEMEASMNQSMNEEHKKMMKPLLESTVTQQRENLKKCKEGRNCNPAYIAEVERAIKNFETYVR